MGMGVSEFPWVPVSRDFHGNGSSTITDHFRGPGKALDLIWSAVCGCMENSFTSKTARVFGRVVRLDSIYLKVKVVGQSSQRRGIVIGRRVMFVCVADSAFTSPRQDHRLRSRQACQRRRRFVPVGELQSETCELYSDIVYRLHTRTHTRTHTVV